MGPRPMGYQFKLGLNMVDEALIASFCEEIAECHAMVSGLISYRKDLIAGSLETFVPAELGS
jgi:hypothetical protein